MDQEKLTYHEAILELEAILKALENVNETDMNKIAKQVERAKILMTFCKNQLTEFDFELEKTLKELG